ncbi:MAG: hypothetical protein KF819_13280 [Labilithrix sp.]|nr:hypothetical protein [Labilithrix sp.]
MKLTRCVVLAIPLLLTPSLAFAEERAPTKAESTKTTNAQTARGKAPRNEDGKIGTTRTTAAETMIPRRDVAENRADERREVQGKRWTAAPLVGYATNDMNVGVGARAGYTFETPIYVGGAFVYHFGERNSAVTPAALTETNTRFYAPAAEVGYDIGVGSVLLRPHLGAAILIEQSATTVNGRTASNTTTTPMLYPGLSAQYMFPQSPLFVGGDTRVYVPLENMSPAFSVMATVGASL